LKLPRTVWVLSAVSLLNDAASEMIAPLLPIFLTATLGAGPAIVALVEGASDAASSVLKLYAGRWSDRGVSARALILGGYGLANIARPLLGLAASWTMVLALRFTDRIGKGLRSAPRDALLAASVPVEIRGRAFGVHRAADHFGAMIGPVVAAGLLAAGVPLQTVFALAGVFGLAVMVTLWFGVPAAVAQNVGSLKPTRAKLEWRALDRRVKGMLISVALLAAASVPEAMVVLWATERGLAVVWVPILWAAAHALRVLVVWPSGLLVDRWGARRVLRWGWSARVAALTILAAVAESLLGVWLAFAFYSMSLAATEAAERAAIAELVPAEIRGTAFGWFHLLTGLAVLPGALALGLMWQSFGAATALALAAVLATLACVAGFTFSRNAEPAAR
jgi:MFS-type transporter involved in bile tolerance (Atg22 family)